MKVLYIIIFICLPFLIVAQPPEVLELKMDGAPTYKIYTRFFSKNVTFSCALIDHAAKNLTLSVWISDSCGAVVNSAEVLGNFHDLTQVWKVDTNFNGDYIVAFTHDHNINLGRGGEFTNILTLRKDLKSASTIYNDFFSSWWGFRYQFDAFENGLVQHRHIKGAAGSSIVIRDLNGKIQDEFQLARIPNVDHYFGAVKMLNNGHLLVSEHQIGSDESTQVLILIDTAKNEILKISEVSMERRYSYITGDFIAVWKSKIYVFGSRDEGLVLYKFNDKLELLESWSLGLPAGYDFVVNENEVHVLGNGWLHDANKPIGSYAIWDFQKERITSAFILPQHIEENSFRNSLTVHNDQVFFHYSRAHDGVTALLSAGSVCDSLLESIEVPNQISLKLKSEIGVKEDYSLGVNKFGSEEKLDISNPSSYKFQVVSTCPTDYFQKSPPVFDTAICTGVTGRLTSRFPVNLKWSTEDSSAFIESDTSGLFVGKGEMGLCSVTDSQRLYVIDSVSLRLPADSFLCPGSDVSFYPASLDYKLKWTFPNGKDRIGYSYTVAKSGTHYVSAYGGGCKVFDSVDFHLYPVPAANVGNDTSMCTGDSIHLLVTGGQTYHWWPINKVDDPHIAQPLIHPKVDQWFLAEATNQYGCSDSDSVHVKVFSKPRADFDMPRFVSMSVKNVVFKNRSMDAQSFNWLVDANPISQDESPIYEFPDSGNYEVTLEVLGDGGCSDLIRRQIRIEPRPLIWVPNAFTPNGDGVNDAFGPNTFMIDQYSMTIFSKSGQLVWKSDFSSPYPVWNGNMDNMESEGAPTGVYVFIIKGFDDNGFPKAVEGKVHLIR